MSTTPTRPVIWSSRRAGLVASLVAVLAGSALHAGETLVIGEPRNPTDETTIRALEEEGRRAVLHQDFATLERIWSERFVVNTPGNVVAPNRAAVFDQFRRGLATYSSYEKEIECIVFDGDLIIVMGAETVVPLNPPTAGQTVQRRYTNIWKIENGTWRLFARHANIVAPGAPSGPPGAPPAKP